MDYCQFALAGTIAGYSRSAPFDITASAKGLSIPADQWQTTIPPTADQWQTAAPDPNTVDPNAPAHAPEQHTISEPIGPPLQALLSLLPESAAQLARRFQPTGQLDLQLHAQRGLSVPDPNRPNTNADQEGPIAYQLTLTCRDAAINCRHFPYPVAGITGTIVFEPDHITIGPIGTNQGPGNISLSGNWRQAPQPDLSLNVNAQQIMLDQRLYHALGPRYQKFWDQFDPTGAVDAHYQLTDDFQGNRNETLIVELLDVSATYHAFPLPLSKMTGNVKFDKHQTTFDIKNARLGKGKLSITGNAVALNSPKPKIEFLADFHDLPINENLADYMPDSARQLFRKLHMTGAADGIARLRYAQTTNEPNTPTAPTLTYDITADIRDATMRYQGFPYPLDHLQAHAQLTNELLMIDSLTGRNGTSEITLKGVVRTNRDYQLHIVAQPLDLTDQLRQAFGPNELALWDSLNPAGPIGLELDIQRRPDQTNRFYNAIITPKKCSIRPRALAFPFTGITGRVVLSPDKMIIDQLISTNESTRLALTGKLTRSNSQPKYDLHITAENFPLTNEFRQVLPERIAPIAQHFQPTGNLGLDLALTYRHPQNPNNPQAPSTPLWNIRGSTWLTEGTLQRPYQTTAIAAHLTGQAKYHPQTKTLDLTADLLPAKMLISDRPLAKTTAHLTYQGNTSNLVLSDISGEFCQGRLAGTLQTNLDPARSAYDVQLIFNRLDLPQLLQAHQLLNQQESKLRGQFEGSIHLKKNHPDQPRRGRFQFLISDAVLGELPITAQLLGVLNLSLPQPGAFNRASLAGKIVGIRTNFDPIHLAGSALALTGKGTMTEPDDQLNLIFSVDTPAYLPDVPVLSSFVDAIKPAFAQVRVTGTFDKPNVEPVALAPIGDTLEQWAPANPTIPATPTAPDSPEPSPEPSKPTP